MTATNAVKSSTGFTGCGKTRSGGRRGFQPPHKANRIDIGFSRGGTLFAYFTGSFEFFRSLFRQCLVNINRQACIRARSPGSYQGTIARLVSGYDPPRRIVPKMPQMNDGLYRLRKNSIR